MDLGALTVLAAIIIAVFAAAKRGRMETGLQAGIATIVLGYLGCYFGGDLSPFGIICAIAVMGGFLIHAIEESK